MSRSFRRPGFPVDGATGARIGLAMERFVNGDSFEFLGVAFRMDTDGVVHCSVESSWDLANVTVATASKDLDEGVAALRDLSDVSSVFKVAIANAPICYELVEDYGMGSTLICSRREGVLEWAPGFPRTPG